VTVQISYLRAGRSKELSRASHRGNPGFCFDILEELSHITCSTAGSHAFAREVIKPITCPLIDQVPLFSTPVRSAVTGESLAAKLSRLVFVPSM
jgi:hypothetical protein